MQQSTSTCPGRDQQIYDQQYQLRFPKPHESSEEIPLTKYKDDTEDKDNCSKCERHTLPSPHAFSDYACLFHKVEFYLFTES